MPDIENVIKGLKYLHDVKRWSPNESEESITARRNITGDALALLKAQEPVVMVGAELTDTELIEAIRKAPITLKPAVDAVPVEWLEEKRKYASEGDSLDVGIAEVLDMWQKEQEAR